MTTLGGSEKEYFQQATHEILVFSAREAFGIDFPSFFAERTSKTRSQTIFAELSCTATLRA